MRLTGPYCCETGAALCASFQRQQQQQQQPLFLVLFLLGQPEEVDSLVSADLCGGDEREGPSAEQKGN